MAREMAGRPACVFTLLCLCLSRVYGIDLITVYSQENPAHHFTPLEHYNPTSSQTELVCEYLREHFSLCGDAEWVDDSTGQILSSSKETVDSEYNKRHLTVTADGTYKCQYQPPDSSCNLYSISVIVRFMHSGTSLPPTQSTGTPPTTSSTDSGGTDATGSSSSSQSSGTPSTEFTGTPQTHFNGLNPLIYTVLSAVLLAVLTIVAIITCFIRSRKAIHRRTLLPRDSPLDYLDFIQENEFTPMTTSEFLASLRERPPTYNESQDIERRIQEERVEGDDNESQPPPLPQRNPGMIAERNNRGRSRETSQPSQETTSNSNNRSASTNRQQQTSTTVTNEAESASRGGGFVDWIEQLDVIVAQPPNQLITELPREQPTSDTSAHGVLPSLDAIV